MSDPQSPDVPEPAVPEPAVPAEPAVPEPAVPEPAPARPPASPLDRDAPNMASVAEHSTTHATNDHSREPGAPREYGAPREPDAQPAASAQPTAAPGRPRGSTRALLVASGRATLALGATAAAAALAAAVLFVPSPALAPEALAITVTPDRADQSLVCAGAVLGLTRGEDPRLAAVANPQRRSAGTGLGESAITQSDALDGGAVVVTLPKEAPAEALAASESVRARTSDVAGLAASECLTPGRTAWLVGGSTTTGRTSWIVLTNAGAVDATVALRVFTEDGPVTAPGTSGIIVAAGAQRVLPLSGIIVGTESPVVEVRSEAGSVAATLQHSIVRGLDASGISIVTPLDAPATRHVIPAVPVIGGQAVLERASDEGNADALTALRMLAPGDSPVDVTVRLIPQSGEAGVALTTTLEPQAVLDLPFTELVDGEYSIVVESSAPTVVAARTSTAGTTGIDLEWFTPVAEIDAGTEVLAAIAPVSSGVSAFLHLFAPDADATVSVDGRTVVVPAGTGLVLESATNAAPILSTTAPLHASVSYRGDSLLASSRILPPPAAARPVTVLPY